jgi:hypothetical protein
MVIQNSGARGRITRIIDLRLFKIRDDKDTLVNFNLTWVIAEESEVDI